MKKLFLFCILILSMPCFAQVELTYSDTNDSELPFQVLVDSCFAHVNMDRVPTGILLDRSFTTIDVPMYNGNLQYTFNTKYLTIRIPKS